MRHWSNGILARVLGAGLVTLTATSAYAGYWAGEVMSYEPGQIVDRFDSYYDDPDAVLGPPPTDTGSSDWPVTPFNSPWSADDVATIGMGGQLTLRLERYVLTDAVGPQLGVFVQQQFSDQSWPDGATSDPVTLWYPDQHSVIEVSEDGEAWVALNGGNPIEQNIPINAFQDVDATTPTDYRQPFEGELSDFDGLDSLADVLEVIGESGGGNWHDLSGTGLDQVGFVRFSVPEEAESSFQLVSLAIGHEAAGAPVPEPASVVLLTVGAAVLTLRRRRGLAG